MRYTLTPSPSVNSWRGVPGSSCPAYLNTMTDYINSMVAQRRTPLPRDKVRGSGQLRGASSKSPSPRWSRPDSPRGRILCISKSMNSRLNVKVPFYVKISLCLCGIHYTCYSIYIYIRLKVSADKKINFHSTKPKLKPLGNDGSKSVGNR